MRSGGMVVLAVGAMVSLACGPIDQSGSSGSSSGGSDAGTTGSGGGSAADGGTTTGSGGGTGGGGTGGGSPQTFSCDGVMPGSVPAPVTVTNARGGGDICWNATADEAGNVAAESHPASQENNWTGNWQVWSPTGSLLGGFSGVGGDVFGQQQGFETTNKGDAVFYSPSGKESKRTKLTGNCRAQAFPAAGAGSVVLEVCGNDLKAYRFDDQGNQAAKANIGPAAQALAAVLDAQGRVLVVAGGPGGFGARWFDGNLNPISDAFGLPGGGGTNVMVRPLIGGGAAIQVDGNWAATVRSGTGSADGVPDWLGSHKNYDLQIIRGGRAYAFIPRAGASPHNALDLYSGAGEKCGSQSFPTDGLSMGPEGTVIGSSGDPACTHPIWSGLLR